MNKIVAFLIVLFSLGTLNAQKNGLVANLDSPFSKLKSINLQDVKWTGGFWKEQCDVEQQNTLPYMWNLYHNDSITHA